LAENFDEQFKNLKVEMTPRTADVEMIIRDLRGDEFSGFSWKNSDFLNPLGIDQLPSDNASTDL
jgi:hypothetical protein